MMIALSFTNPFLLGGMALASLPIIIHLLNRRRFKQMEWAAMDFLLKAAVRNRKRVRLENLLLLLLRTLIVVLLILAVARPFTKSQDALASMFGSDGATERIIVLDDSHSMRAGQGNRSAFEVAKQLTRKLINRL
ncbi:MAG: BatA domain-containing protein, partial [Planctomycetota bacterium]